MRAIGIANLGVPPRMARSYGRFPAVGPALEPV
jgi:hypothetical protein